MGVMLKTKLVLRDCKTKVTSLCLPPAWVPHDGKDHIWFTIKSPAQNLAFHRHSVNTRWVNRLTCPVVICASFLFCVSFVPLSIKSSWLLFFLLLILMVDLASSPRERQLQILWSYVTHIWQLIKNDGAGEPNMVQWKESEIRGSQFFLSLHSKEYGQAP